jgi:ABC-type Fe3+ transport system permease subunit
MTLLRSLIIALLAVAAARAVCPLLADHRQSVRRAAWILLLGPYFTPVLLTGYAYANSALSLIHHPVANNLLYSALLWWKFTPIAAVILHFTPSPISAEAVHCRRLAAGSRSGERLFLARAGCARGLVAAFAVVFLCAFAEFEMASLMIVKSWTVSLFDLHAGGLALSESLRQMLVPLSCEAVAIGTAFLILGRQQLKPAARTAASGSSRWLGWCHLALAFTFVLVVPAAMMLWGTLRGLNLLFENFVLGREIIASLLFAAGASTLTAIIVFWLGAVARRSLAARTILIAAAFTGLLGPLVLSLTVLAAVQLPGLIALRDTPAPLVFTLCLVLLPMALVLRRVLELTGHQSAFHLARLLPKTDAARDLAWRLSVSGKFWLMAILFVWAFWDLTCSSILAPVGMTPVTVRLYNLMHYGQIAALSAMTCAAFLAPISILMLALATRRWWAPR